LIFYGLWIQPRESHDCVLLFAAAVVFCDRGAINFSANRI
jgi:uncharacterized protein (DUF488 family)